MTAVLVFSSLKLFVVLDLFILQHERQLVLMPMVLLSLLGLGICNSLERES